MSNTSRVLRPDQLQTVARIRWRETSPPQTRQERLPESSAYAAPVPDRECIEHEAYRRGLAEGKALGKDLAEAEVQPVLERLTRALVELSSVRARLRRDAEEDVVKLSIAIARRVLHRELTLDPESIGGLIKAALEKIESHELCRVRVHPDQETMIRTILGRYSPTRIELVADPALGKGDVVFETSQGTVDASVEAQLREIERGLADRLSR
jgi:flagellar assembly protein FliH